MACHMGKGWFGMWQATGGHVPVSAQTHTATATQSSALTCLSQGNALSLGLLRGCAFGRPCCVPCFMLSLCFYGLA